MTDALLLLSLPPPQRRGGESPGDDGPLPSAAPHHGGASLFPSPPHSSPPPPPPRNLTGWDLAAVPTARWGIGNVAGGKPDRVDGSAPPLPSKFSMAGSARQNNRGCCPAAENDADQNPAFASDSHTAADRGVVTLEGGGGEGRPASVKAASSLGDPSRAAAPTAATPSKDNADA